MLGILNKKSTFKDNFSTIIFNIQTVSYINLHKCNWQKWNKKLWSPPYNSNIFLKNLQATGIKYDLMAPRTWLYQFCFSRLTEFDPTGCDNAKLDLHSTVGCWHGVDLSRTWSPDNGKIRTPLKRSEYFCKMEFLLELVPHFTGWLCPEIPVIRCMHLLP